MVKSILIGVLITLCGLLLLRNCSPDPVISSSVDSLRAANLRLSASFDSLRVADSLARVKEIARQDSFRTVIRGRERRIAQLKRDTVVKYVRVMYPVVDTLITTQDSTILAQETEIKTMQAEERKEEQRDSLSIGNLQTQNKNLQGINSSLEAYSKSQRNTIKWQRVELWIWRIGGSGFVLWQALKK